MAAIDRCYTDTDHVVEQDAKAPDGEGVAVVAAAADPLGRGVHAGACAGGDE